MYRQREGGDPARVATSRAHHQSHRWERTGRGTVLRWARWWSSLSSERSCRCCCRRRPWSLHPWRRSQRFRRWRPDDALNQTISWSPFLMRTNVELLVPKVTMCWRCPVLRGRKVCAVGFTPRQRLFDRADRVGEPATERADEPVRSQNGRRLAPDLLVALRAAGTAKDVLRRAESTAAEVTSLGKESSVRPRGPRVSAAPPSPDTAARRHCSNGGRR